MTQRRIYQNEYPYFATFRTREGYPLFDEAKYAELLSKVIFETSLIKGYDVLAYQIMPDHFHLLAYNKFRVHPAVGALHSKMGSAGKIINTSAGTAARARRIFNISELIHGIKSYYYSRINYQYGINFHFFQPRFYSRIVNNRKYLENIIYYIKQNPIKEKSPQKYHQSPYQYFNCNKINNLF